MAVDTFICGSCEICFFNLDDFVNHKKTCEKEPQSVTQNLPQTDSTIVNDNEPQSVCENLQQDGEEMNKAATLELVALNNEKTEVESNTQMDYEMVIRWPSEQTEGQTQQSAGRKRGRPRKAETVKKREAVSKRQEKPEKPELPEKGNDGKFHCVRCKLAFTRERTFLAHKCLANSDYVDVTKKEVVSGEESEVEQEDDGDDVEAQYSKAIKQPKRKRRRTQYKLKKPISSNEASGTDAANLGGGDGVSVNVMEKDQSATRVEVNESGDTSITELTGNSRTPLFQTEKERLEFEEAINVDLSVVDDMYSVHLIEQNLNENAQVDLPRSNQLTIFSCNTCDKVFKTLSHMRLHCLTHTDLKPFQCPKCEYTSNSKGNMYTHMRKHTGQFYMCSHCSFMTVNKTHLKEHEGTHSSERHECELCKKDYNTMKSLVNHVRKYHHRHKDGQEYLERLQPKTNRMNGLLYLCHVCNRKFKKKVDRDRHLFVHNIRDGPNVAACDLCDYVASRRLYLMAHYKKHRIIYHCCVCDGKFLSTIRLHNHVSEEHQEECNSSTWEELFAKCIDLSQYLPELSSGEENSNIPEELKEGNDGDDTQQPEEEKTDEDMYKKLGYRPLTMKVLETLRNTFGHMECEFCGRLFGSKIDYEPHLRTHTGEKPYACDLCGYRGNTKDNLKRHIEKEHDEKTYPCEECDFVAKNRTQLWSHNQKHCNTQCKVCNAKCKNKKKLILHLKVKHPELTTEDIDKMTGVAKARPRGKIGKKTFKCPYCERVYLRSATDLQKHIWIHQDVKPFQCDICSYACRSKNNLKSHMLRHSNQKPFACRFCSKEYKSRTALRWHERSHKEGKMKCDKCSYEATQKSHLKRHMETHDIVKQYVCQHCDYSANTIGYMKIHYTRFHKGIQFSSAQSKIKTNSLVDAKVFKCLSCDYLFGNLSDMKRHLKVRHHVQVDDMQALDSLSMDPSTTTQFCVPVEHNQTIPTSEVQVVHIADPATSTSQEIDATVALQALQYSGGEQVNIDEKTASAVNILQQIIDMSNQGGVTQTEEGDEGLVAVNPETIIVHQDEEVVVSSTKSDGTPEQVVIQYIHGEDNVTAPVYLVSEPQTETIQAETITMTSEAGPVHGV